MLTTLLLAVLLQSAPVAEEPVEPYVQADANAGATPFASGAMWHAFHAREGVARIVDDLVTRSQADPRIAETFKGQDMVRLRRTLNEQFCYILAGGCAYSGRTMKDAHKDMGLQQADMTALVENLQAAMRKEGVSFRAQNHLLAKLAPMHRVIVER